MNISYNEPRIPYIEFEVKIEERDVRTYLYQLIKQSSGVKIVTVLYLLSVLLAFVIFFPKLNFVQISVFLLLVLLLSVLFFYLIERSFLKLLKKDKYLYADRVYCVDAKIIESKMEEIGILQYSPWASIVRISDLRTHIFVWYRYNRAYVLAKRCLSEEKLNSLHILISQNMKKY